LLLPSAYRRDKAFKVEEEVKNLTIPEKLLPHANGLPFVHQFPFRALDVLLCTVAHEHATYRRADRVDGAASVRFIPERAGYVRADHHVMTMLFNTMTLYVCFDMEHFVRTDGQKVTTARPAV
jgi:hypothetical protein